MDKIRDFFEHNWHRLFVACTTFGNWCRKQLGLPRKPVHYSMHGRGVVIHVVGQDQ